MPVRVVSLPGEDEELEEVAVLGLGQVLPVHLRMDQARHEVVSRVLSPLLPDLPPVLEDMPAGRGAERQEPRVDVGRVLLRVRAIVRIGRRRHLARQLDQHRGVLLGKPEDRDEDADREGLGDLGDEVELALRDCTVEEVLRDFPRVRLVFLHLAARERVAHELSQARVVGRIRLDQ